MPMLGPRKYTRGISPVFVRILAPEACELSGESRVPRHSSKPKNSPPKELSG